MSAEDLRDVVARYKAHNDRLEAQLASEGAVPQRSSLPPPASNLIVQIQSIIAAAERRLPSMARDAQDEVSLLLQQLKALI